ncbi:lipid-A-disaccharide synthase [Chiayiivirga flava]|uniref:Lipid-A-disaccharide synthase n=1 Tax=Chiayiivirga flava TaxID=659595 RepID=A0A7W8FZH6_9GAMM|nr:lipid-A-disaccharide synthase [Chiayiivirga flava]MBB5208477.1 lipid-A-disaccharide synthase [Chiayiivirga flava]
MPDRAHAGTAAAPALPERAAPIPDSPFPIPGRPPRRPRIALVAGEASGDLLGAELVVRLRERWPDAEFAGIGGAKMRAAGVETWHDCGELAVMGLAEVLRHLPRLLRLRRETLRRVLAWQPDVFVGIDAPDFNLGLERRLKQRGNIRTVHYVSPSVWAWREGRAATIGRSADRVLCLFPMEPPIYARHGVDARFIGHPLADTLPLDPDRAAARAALGVSDDVPVLALLPGSRLGEIARLGESFLQGAAQVAQRIPNLHVLIPAANPACRGAIERLLAQVRVALPDCRILDGHASEAMIASDVVLLASGTATLEALLAKRPMVIAYRISALTYAIVMGLGMMKTDRYSLPNALAGETVVPELMQHDCTPDNIAREVLAWFEHPERIAALQPRFDTIHRALRQDASARAADAIAEFVDAAR